MQKIIPYLAAIVAAFLITALVGRFLVPALRRMKAGQSIKTDGPTWHMSKQALLPWAALCLLWASLSQCWR